VPYPKPTAWDYLRLAAAMIGWRFWRVKEEKKRGKKNVQEHLYGEHEHVRNRNDEDLN
jgi:hypothetical protein